MSATPPAHARRAQFRLSTVVLACALVAVLACCLVARAETSAAGERFTSQATEFRNAASQRVREVETVLNSFVAALKTIDDANYERARPFADEILRLYPSIGELSVILPVRAEALPALTKTMRSRGYPDFSVNNYTPDGLQPVEAEPGQVIYPIVFNAPVSLGLLGMDPYPSRYFQSAMQATMQTGEAVASATFPLLDSGKNAGGYVLFRADFSSEFRSPENARHLASVLVRGAELIRPIAVPERASLHVARPNQIPDAGDPPAVFAVDAEPAGTLARMLLPVVTFEQQLKQVDQPFNIELARQLDWSDLRWSRIVAAAVLGALVTWLSLLLVNLRRQRRYERADDLARTFRDRDRLAVTLHSIQDAVVTTNSNGAVDFINPAAASLLGWLPSRAIGRPLDAIVQLHNNHGAPVSAAMDADAWAMDDSARSQDDLTLERNGAHTAVEVTWAPLHGADQQIAGMAMVIRDVEQERSLRERLSHEARHDALTGLLNRRAFQRTLNEAVEESRHGSHHALLFFDLDRFKQVNDTVGHAAGDALLRQLTERLQARTRGSDALARIGGDEFALLLKQCGPDNAKRFALSLHDAVGQFAFTWDDQAFTIGFSGGLVMLDGQIGSAAAALHQADLACYHAKQSGRNQIALAAMPDEADGPTLLESAPV